MTITIGTIKNRPDGHYLGRNGESYLGNPFAVTNNTVANVVQGYRVYLNLVVEKGFTPGEAVRETKRKHPELKLSVSTAWRLPTAAQMVKELQALKAKLKAGESLTLTCHCYTQPQDWTGTYQFRCHAEAIAGWLMWSLAQDQLPHR